MANVHDDGSKRPEIKKLPRITCELCGSVFAKPMIDNGRCRNTLACEVRQHRNAERDERRREAKKP